MGISGLRLLPGISFELNLFPFELLSFISHQHFSSCVFTLQRFYLPNTLNVLQLFVTSQGSESNSNCPNCDEVAIVNYSE